MIIHGTNTIDDVEAVQNAVNTVRPPEPIELEGMFNFGGGWDGRTGGPIGRKTVVINKSVRIQSYGTAMAQVQGGGARLQCGDTFGRADSGPFQVQGGDVVFEHIHFSGWKGEAISVLACDGLQVRNCRFTQPFPGTATAPDFVGPDPNRPFRFVHAVLAFGPGCTGSFVATGNQCDLRDYATDPLYVIHPTQRPGTSEPVPTTPTKHTEALADDEQFLACLLTSFTEIRVTGNQIWGQDDGLEVIANQNNQLEIANNKMWLRQRIGERFGGHFGHIGIVCCVNRDAVIKGNRIDLTGPGMGLVLSGEKFHVTDRNEVILRSLSDDVNSYPLAGIVLGMNMSPHPLPVEPSLSNSIITGNTISGTAYYGIMTFDGLFDVVPCPYPAVPPPNKSHGNTIENNDLSSFKPIYTSLLLRSETYDNTCTGRFPSPEPDRSGYINEGNNLVTPLPLVKVGNLSPALHGAA